MRAVLLHGCDLRSVSWRSTFAACSASVIREKGRQKDPHGIHAVPMPRGVSRLHPLVVSPRARASEDGGFTINLNMSAYAEEFCFSLLIHPPTVSVLVSPTWSRVPKMVEEVFNSTQSTRFSSSLRRLEATSHVHR